MLDELEYRMRASAHGELPQGHSKAELSEAKQTPLQTLYYGGGTPSLLSMAELESLTNGIRRWFDLDGVREFTLEVNPEDVTPAKVKDWRSLGVNRISLGIQSFDDRNLARMNRAHNAAQGREALHMFQNEGFES
ncbi:MAG: radical SAM protein, partial [Chitinophagia bacterium]|nr:radical SAM protein [Chitinophagia bacterium]